MHSTGEVAITLLLGHLRCAIPDITVLRNAVVPTAIPENGLIILRDGDIGEPSLIFSPPRYAYYHQAVLEVMVQNGDDDTRDAQLDALLVQVGHALQQPFAPDDGIDCCRIGSLELTTEPIEGAATLKIAHVPIIVEYVTTNPLC